MNKILLINIDPTHRSAYTCKVAALFKKKYPSSHISVVVSADNELFHTVNLFDSVLTLNVATFFSSTQNLDNQSIEDQMRSFMSPYINQEWDLVVNLSSNLLGTIYTCFLKYKSILGPHSKEDDPTVLYSNMASFLLMNSHQHHSFFHFSYLYKDLIKTYYDVEVSSYFKDELDQKFNKYIKELLAQKNKNKIVLIDSSCQNNKKISEMRFLSDTYLALDAHKDILPILFSSDPESETTIISQFKHLTEKEVNFVKCQNRGLLYLIKHASLVITDDLYLKALADLGGVQSLLVAKELEIPLGDFSAIENSCLMFFKSIENGLAESIVKLSVNLVEKRQLQVFDQENINIYQTVVYDGLPTLRLISRTPQESESYNEFAKWWVGLKYLANRSQLNLPKVNIDKDLWMRILNEEKSRVSSTDVSKLMTPDDLLESEGLWQVEGAFYKFNAQAQRLKSEISSIKGKMLNFISDQISSHS